MAWNGAHRPQRWLVSLAAVMIMAASCSPGGVDDSASASSATTGVDRPSTTAFVSPNDEDDEEEEETIDDLEAGWAARRDLVVGSLSRLGFGVGEDNVLVGPGQFELDLDDCPGAWIDDTGITPDVIRIAMTTAQTGEFRHFSDVALGMQAYFDYVNETGGIDGRQIEFVVRDDG